jgi:hypothetical protein
MDEHDSPTTPGTIEAASGGVDEDDRDTIPAPAPARSDLQSSDSTPTPAAPMRLAAVADGVADDLETLRDSEVETLRNSDIETVRPPPPDAAIATPTPNLTLVAAAASTATKGAAESTAAAPPKADVSSSLAPRELSQRPPPSPRAQQRTVGLLIAAALLGIGLLALQRQDRTPSEPRAAASGTPVDTTAAAPSTAPALDEPPVVPSAPVATAVPAPAPSPELGADGAPRAAPPIVLAATAERAGANGAGARRRAARARAPQIAPAADLPETPSREAIGAALQDLRAAFELCSDGRSGVAELDLTIRGSGALAHAVVGGDFAGTPQGSCIARTLRKVSFTPFQKPKFRVLYRLML